MDVSRSLRLETLAWVEHKALVLSHASEEGAGAEDKGVAGGAKSLFDNLKSKLSKPKDKAA